MKSPFNIRSKNSWISILSSKHRITPQCRSNGTPSSLLLDNVPSIQQSATLAKDRLANYSEELAESVVQNDIITQWIYSLAKPNRFFKKAAFYVFKSVANHSPDFTDDIMKSDALEP